MEYKLEDLKFLNMKKERIYVSNPRLRDGLHIYQIENTLTEEEKLEIIDEMKENVGSYLLNIIKKWESEKETLPKDQYGHPKTVSKKAWIKRNDTRKMTSKYDKLGEYWLFGTKFKKLSITCPSTDYSYSMEYTGKSVVHQWFHDLCEELYRAEKKYFNENDPKQLKLKKVRDYGERYHVFFGNTDINDIVWNNKTDVSVEFLDEVIKAYMELEESIKNISLKFDKLTV